MGQLRPLMFGFSLGVALLALSGCDPFSQADSMMDEYVERVGRVLDRSAELQPIPSGDLMPRRRERRLTMPTLDMDMLDFLSLYGCELQYVVGERNSVMGRVMQPLNRLRYELRFIKAAQDCLPRIEKKELRSSIEQAITSKVESLPIAVWNATWGSEEIESLLTLSKGPLPTRLSAEPAAQLAGDMRQVNEMLAAVFAGDHSLSLESIGPIQQRWEAQHLAGQLFISAHLLTTRLGDATLLLQTRLNGRPLCLDQKPNNRSEQMEGVLYNVYSAEVQPYLAQVRQLRDDLIPPLARMAELQAETMPPDFHHWYREHLSLDNPEGLWGRLDAAMKRHTESWQRLLDQCGLTPGSHEALVSADFPG